MIGRHITTFAMAAFLIVFSTQAEALAGQKFRSGTYQGRKTNGTWQQNVNRTPGHVERSTTRQNESGEDSRMAEKTGRGEYLS